MKKFIKSALAGICAGIVGGAAGPVGATIWKGQSSIVLSGLYVFGDSLSDSGNVTLAGGDVPFPNMAASYAWGRFTNGPVYVDYIAQAFGLQNVAAMTSGGNNYAFGGAEINASNNPPGLALQLGWYASRTHGRADPNALYIVFGGGNDINHGSDLTERLAMLSRIVDALIKMGATNILIPNVPDLGRTPGHNTDPARSALMTARSIAFNQGLKQMIGQLEAKHRIDILEADVFNWSNEILNNGAAYGFSDTRTHCVAGHGGGESAACSNPDQHFYWDDLHPTARVHQIMAERLIATIIAAAVPAP